MILLFNTTDEIELVTAQAVTIDTHASFVDMSQANPPVVQGTTSGNLNKQISTATTTDIVDGPASSVTRNVKTLNIRNRHATDSCTVTVQFDANGTKYELHKATLAAGEALEYVEGVGFFVLGAISPTFTKSLGSDLTVSSTTPAEATGLSLGTSTGNFAFEYYLMTNSAATTTGHKMSVNYDGTVTQFAYYWYWVTALSTASDDVPDQDHVAAPGGVMSAYTARAKGTGGLGTTTDVDATGDVLYRITGLATVTVAGNFELWFAGDAAANTTLKAGSLLVVTKG